MITANALWAEEAEEESAVRTLCIAILGLFLVAAAGRGSAEETAPTPAPVPEPAPAPKPPSVAAPVSEKLVNLKVLPEGCVDTASLEGIVEGVTKGANTDEEKVLAFFQWYRRLNFHHRLMGGDRRDVLKVINSYGCNLCGSQAAVLVVILQKAGFKTRVVCGEAGGDFGGHTFVEVFYGEKWHCIDTMTSFAVYTRDEPPHLASLAEMKADPTLVPKAVEEKRAVPGFLPCLDHQEHTGAERDELKKTMGGADLPWSTLLFKSGSLLDFWSKAPSASRTLDAAGTYGGKYTPGVMDFTLKLGEELVREWDNAANLWVKPVSHPDFGPHHTCGYADEFDSVNFKFFEPYLKENFGHTKKCYRWFGNGFLDWKPAAGIVVRAACKLENLAPNEGSFFEVQGDGGVGKLTIPVKCPYAGVAIELDLMLKQTGAGSVTRVLLVEGKNAREVWKKEGDAEGLQKIVIPHDGAPAFDYELRIEAQRGPNGTAALALTRVRTIFQENIYALPSLAPGKNVVHVTAAGPVKLAASKLVVRYEWAEGDGWKTEQSVVKEFTELPATFEVEVAGPKMPRMKRLVVRLEPAAK